VLVTERHISRQIRGVLKGLRKGLVAEVLWLCCSLTVLGAALTLEGTARRLMLL